MSKDYKELVEQIADELWEDLSYTSLDFDNREDCAKNIISIISKNLINDFLYNLRNSLLKHEVVVIFDGAVVHAGKITELIEKYEEEFKNVERL